MALTKVTTGGIKDGTITNEDISTTTSISQDKLAAKPGASSIASGLMTSADKIKLDGVADNANNYSHPSAHTVSEVTGLQGAIDSKVDDTQVLTDVPVNALFTDTVYTHPASHSVSEITGLQGLLDGKTTETYVNTQITNVVGVAPAALDTLTELAAALGDDANYAATTTTALGNRYTKAEADAKIVELAPATDISGKLDKSGGTMTGSLIMDTNAGIASTTSNQVIRVLNPGNASLEAPDGTVGAIRILIPPSGDGEAPMMTIKVQVYEYTSNESFELNIGGHFDGSSNWYNVLLMHLKAL